MKPGKFPKEIILGAGRPYLTALLPEEQRPNLWLRAIMARPGTAAAPGLKEGTPEYELVLRRKD